MAPDASSIPVNIDYAAKITSIGQLEEVLANVNQAEQQLMQQQANKEKLHPLRSYQNQLRLEKAIYHSGEKILEFNEEAEDLLRFTGGFTSSEYTVANILLRMFDPHAKRLFYARDAPRNENIEIPQAITGEDVTAAFAYQRALVGWIKRYELAEKKQQEIAKAYKQREKRRQNKFKRN